MVASGDTADPLSKSLVATSGMCKEQELPWLQLTSDQVDALKPVLLQSHCLEVARLRLANHILNEELNIARDSLQRESAKKNLERVSDSKTETESAESLHIVTFYETLTETVLRAGGGGQAREFTLDDSPMEIELRAGGGGVATNEHRLLDTSSATVNWDRPAEQLAVGAELKVDEATLVEGFGSNVYRHHLRMSQGSRLDIGEDVVKPEPEWGSLFVIRPNSKLGQAWGFVSSALILYVATVLPYKLSFLDFALHPLWDSNHEPLGWVIVERSTEWLFIVDWLITFFTSYVDERGKEVRDLRYIACNYVSTMMFWINALACIPEALSSIVIAAVQGSGGGSTSGNKALLLLRLQRITRLARLLRLMKLAKLGQLSIVRKLIKLRGPRMIGLALGMFWAMHVLGCGWHLIAAIHSDPQTTWIYAREVENSPPGVQWVNSMYFILVVFTTVGFGDISGKTVAEMMYAAFVMIIGTVLNSVFLSEIISMLSALDRRQLELTHVVNNIQDFAEHTHLDEKDSEVMENFARSRKGTVAGLPLDQAIELFNGGYVDRESLPIISKKVFGGKLISNRLLVEVANGVVFTPKVPIPPRLVLFLASMSSEREWLEGEAVYKTHEMASAIFLMLHGTCAYVTKESASGVLSPYQLMGFNTCFGDYEVLCDIEIRHANARCESRSASALVLPKRSFLELCNDYFPLFLRSIRRMSHIHEFSRRSRCQRAPPNLLYKQLAALTILNAFRSWKEGNLRYRSYRSLKPVRHEMARENMNR
eukprot:TRINITY_DN41718_c0_g1_i1.p1 TRINITY_DN41718_c0_g1~~TRINITY_DN41718_c0_g1_i1.p1  ORF type:complete len:767 (+),score=119.81 TRINITY_DN41718_c0_g1_i1:29-2329(+)